MGYSLTVEVRSERQAKEISEVLKKIIEDLGFVYHYWISNDKNDHVYAPEHIDHAVYLSYNIIDRGLHKSIWNTCQSIASELNTKMFHDDEEIDPHKDKIEWQLTIYSNNIFMRLLMKLVNRKYNKTLREFEQEFNQRIKPLLGDYR